MSQVQEVTLNPPAQGAGGTLILAAATLNRLTIAQDGYYTITVDATVFMCRGTASTVPVVGTEQILVAGNTYRVGPMKSGERLCFISTPGGNVYYTPGS